MADTLVSQTGIWMFGRVVTGVTLTAADLPANGGPVLAEMRKPGAGFARIYAISFEGKFYNLPKTAIFLVHGPGDPAADTTGLAATEIKFENGVRVWQYEKDAISLRADIITGTLEEILLDATLSATSKYALASRAELTARAELTSRAEMMSRAELIARHRLRD